MKKKLVIKIGGGCLKDENSIRHIKNILNKFSKKYERIILVVSAFARTTENLKDSFNNRGFLDPKIMNFHKDICIKLSFETDDIPKICFRSNSVPYAGTFSETLSLGENLSTEIIFHYLNVMEKMDISRIKFNEVIRTEKPDTLGVAVLKHKKTVKLINEVFSSINSKIIITEGFLGIDIFSSVTTLGFEGSDLTAGIWARALDTDFILFKEFGLHDCNPDENKHAKLIKKLTFHDYKCLFLEAKIIHSKTIFLCEKSPRKEIKIYSFWDMKPRTRIY